MKVKRKNIDLPEGTLKHLKLLSVLADPETDPKNYIQDHIIAHVKKQAKKHNLPES